MTTKSKKSSKLGLALFVLVGMGTSGALLSLNHSTPQVLGASTVNPGSSINSAISSASNGDTITVNAGNYDERVNISKAVKLICASPKQCQTKGFDVKKVDGASITGFFIKDATQTCFDVVGSNTIIQNNRCETVHLGSSDRDGVNFFGSNNKFLYNDFVLDATEKRQLSSGGWQPHPDCFQTWGNDTARGYAINTLFEGNTCDNRQLIDGTNYEVKGQGFMVDGYNAGDDSTKTNGLIIRNNVIRSRQIYILNMPGVVMENNVIDIYTDGNGGYLQDNPRLTLKNNLYYNSTQPSASVMNAGSTIISKGSNWYYRPDGNYTRTDDIVDKRGTNPLFTNPANGDFHISANSPACTSGVGGTYVGAYPCGTAGGVAPTPTTAPVVTPSPTPAPIPGDAVETGDTATDQVNTNDYAVWALNYLKSITGFSNADFNNSGKVDGVDYVIWALNYGY